MGMKSMATITTQNYHDCYYYGKEVATGDMDKTEAIRTVALTGMDPGSARMYISCVVALITDGHYTATVKQDATSYFLSKIYEEYHFDGLRRALTVFKDHLDYQSDGKNNLPGMLKLYDEFFDIL